MGFAAHPSAMAVATRYLQPIAPEAGNGVGAFKGTPHRRGGSILLDCNNRQGS